MEEYQPFKKTPGGRVVRRRQKKKNSRTTLKTIEPVYHTTGNKNKD